MLYIEGGNYSQDPAFLCGRIQASPWNPEASCPCFHPYQTKELGLLRQQYY